MQFVDGISFLKAVPGVIGLAGLITLLTREQQPASNVELVNLVRNVQTGFVLVGCTALILLSLWLLFRSESPGFDVGLSRQPAAPVGSYSMLQTSIGQVAPPECNEQRTREPAAWPGKNAWPRNPAT
jgi:hypothetical protein